MELKTVFSKYFNPVTHETSKINSELCKKCGGCCCKSMGCHISPFDLKEISVQSIISLIDESECISIDWWEGNPNTEEHVDSRTYFLRIKNKDAKTIDPSYGGICSILTDNGCPLSFEYRPKGARDLVPKEPSCHDRYSKRQCAIDWYNYQDVMEIVYDYYFMKGDISEDRPAIFGDVFDDILALMLNLKNRTDCNE